MAVASPGAVASVFQTVITPGLAWPVLLTLPPEDVRCQSGKMHTYVTERVEEDFLPGSWACPVGVGAGA